MFCFLGSGKLVKACPFIVFHNLIDIIMLDTFCCVVAGPASLAKAELKIINTDTSDLIPIPEASGNDLADFCRCSVSDRAAIDNQCFHFVHLQ